MSVAAAVRAGATCCSAASRRLAKSSPLRAGGVVSHGPFGPRGALFPRGPAADCTLAGLGRRGGPTGCSNAASLVVPSLKALSPDRGRPTPRYTTCPKKACLVSRPSGASQGRGDLRVNPQRTGLFTYRPIAGGIDRVKSSSGKPGRTRGRAGSLVDRLSGGRP